MGKITNLGTQGGQITFDKLKYEKLKVMYMRAEKSNYKDFMFEGHLLLTSYAKYLLEYLEPHFKN